MFIAVHVIDIKIEIKMPTVRLPTDSSSAASGRPRGDNHFIVHRCCTLAQPLNLD